MKKIILRWAVSNSASFLNSTVLVVISSDYEGYKPGNVIDLGTLETIGENGYTVEIQPFVIK